eukprot:366391-Chlamydomonas_euryale.AAC.32
MISSKLDSVRTTTLSASANAHSGADSANAPSRKARVSERLIVASCVIKATQKIRPQQWRWSGRGARFATLMPWMVELRGVSCVKVRTFSQVEYRRAGGRGDDVDVVRKLRWASREPRGWWRCGELCPPPGPNHRALFQVGRGPPKLLHRKVDTCPNAGRLYVSRGHASREGAAWPRKPPVALQLQLWPCQSSQSVLCRQQGQIFHD